MKIMKSPNTEVRDIPAFIKGYNFGFKIAGKSGKLKSVTPNIMKSVFQRNYKNAFYQGVTEGFQYFFELEKKQLKQQLRENIPDKSDREETLRNINWLHELQHTAKSPKGGLTKEERERMESRLTEMKASRVSDREQEKER